MTDCTPPQPTERVRVPTVVKTLSSHLTVPPTLERFVTAHDPLRLQFRRGRHNFMLWALNLSGIAILGCAALPLMAWLGLLGGIHLDFGAVLVTVACLGLGLPMLVIGQIAYWCQLELLFREDCLVVVHRVGRWCKTRHLPRFLEVRVSVDDEEADESYALVVHKAGRPVDFHIASLMNLDRAILSELVSLIYQWNALAGLSNPPTELSQGVIQTTDS